MSHEREVFKEESSLVFQGESSPVFLEDTRPVLLGKTGFLARQVLSVSVVTTATGGVSTNALVEQEQKSVARTRNHDLPPIENSDNLLEQPWPLLSGSSSSNSESRTNSGSSSWAEFRTTRKPFMFDGNQWPSLGERLDTGRIGEDRKKNSVRFLGGSPENEQRRISRVDSSVLVGNNHASASCSYSLHLPREYDGGDIPEAPTLQKSKADDGENSLGLASGGKGWMRLPPLVMHSSSQQQQKRSRQAAFSTGESSEESLNSSNSAKVGDGGIRNSSFPPVYLMLNKDFVVISPLKENLLLTLALTGRKKPLGDLDGICEKSDGILEKRIRRQVFVGRFEAFSSFVRFGLGRDARRVVTEANAGGTSTISESLSVEYFVRKFQAKDVVTEMEVEYCAMNWKKVDYICTLYGQRVGISVTRAMSYPNPEDFSSQMAYRLLYKKLFGLVVARHGVTERHSFSQCILHVWCETTSTAELLQAQYKEVSEELDITDDVIMVLTVAEGWHARPIFYESCLETS